MDEKQFKELMEKLEEIRCGIIDVETNTERLTVITKDEINNLYDIIDMYRSKFGKDDRYEKGKATIKKIKET